MGWKSSSMSWKKWWYDFFVFKIGFYVKSSARNSTSIVETRGYCTFGWIGNKNLVPDWHISIAKMSVFKTLNLFSAGRWEAETRCEACHVRGVYHHGREALCIGHFFFSTLLTTLFLKIKLKQTRGLTFVRLPMNRVRIENLNFFSQVLLHAPSNGLHASYECVQ